MQNTNNAPTETIKMGKTSM